MRRALLLLPILALLLVGCGNAVSDKYDKGRENQEKKADKMMNDAEN